MRDSIRLRAWLSVAMLPLIAMLLTACPNTNPIRTAETIEQKADATYGQYVILKEQGAAILKNTAVPADIKRPLAEAMVKSAPIAKNLQDAILEVERIRSEVAEGVSTEDKWLRASEKLNDWITALAPLIVDLRASIKAAD